MTTFQMGLTIAAKSSAICLRETSTPKSTLKIALKSV